MAFDNQVTSVRNSAAPDALLGNSMGSALAAAFITLYLIGPDGTQEMIPGLTSLSVVRSYPGSGYQEQASTFRRERTIGSQHFAGQGSRIQQRLRALPVLIARCYKLPRGQDARLDMMSVTVVAQYCLVGPNFDYAQAIDAETRTWAECYFSPSVGDDLVTSGTGNASETFSFESQNARYEGGDVLLVTAGYSANFPKNAVGSASSGEATGGRSGNSTSGLSGVPVIGGVLG